MLPTGYVVTAHCHERKGAEDSAGRAPGDPFGASGGPWPGCHGTLQGGQSEPGLPKLRGGQWETPPAAMGAAAHRACDPLWDDMGPEGRLRAVWGWEGLWGEAQMWETA